MAGRGRGDAAHHSSTTAATVVGAAKMRVGMRHAPSSRRRAGGLPLIRIGRPRRLPSRQASPQDHSGGGWPPSRPPHCRSRACRGRARGEGGGRGGPGWASDSKLPEAGRAGSYARPPPKPHPTAAVAASCSIRSGASDKLRQRSPRLGRQSIHAVAQGRDGSMFLRDVCAKPQCIGGWNGRGCARPRP